MVRMGLCTCSSSSICEVESSPIAVFSVGLAAARAEKTSIPTAKAKPVLRIAGVNVEAISQGNGGGTKRTGYRLKAGDAVP